MAMVRSNLDYTVVFARSARKELESIDFKVACRIIKKIENLQNTSRPEGCKKLKGQNNLWRIRVGDYRVVYSIDDSKYIIDIVIVRHRSKAYKDLQ